MLAKEKPDIVGIGPAGPDQHHEMVLACAEQGCHMYMEKPFCRSLEEADDMVRACESKHLKLAIAHQTRYSPLVPVVKQMIGEGKLGRILEVRARGKEDARGGGGGPVRAGHAHDGPDPHLFGEPNWCLASMTRAANRHRADVRDGNEGLGPLAGDGIQAMYGLPDGVTGYFRLVSRLAGSPSRFGLQVFGSKGVLEFLSGYLGMCVFCLTRPGLRSQRRAVG